MDRWKVDGWILLRSLEFLDCLSNRSALYSIHSEEEEFPTALRKG